jgi:tetratricopeptide (TPR) repeat protein
MDLLDLDGQKLYFDEPMPDEVSLLLSQAAADYGSGKEELLLLKAYFIAPENLSVLVALYRCYYYQHRLEAAQQVARRALALVAARIGFPEDWRQLNEAELAHAVFHSMGLVRFYMLTLKAEAYLYLRLGDIPAGRERLQKVAELDSSDHFGARALLEMLAESELAKQRERAMVANVHS